MHRLSFLALLIVFGVILTACGGGDTGPSHSLTIHITADRHGVPLGEGDQSIELTADVSGRGSGATVTWTVGSNAGTLSSNKGKTVVWTAPGDPGEYEITAVASSGTRTVTASVPLGAYNRCDSGNLPGTAAEPCVISTVYQLQAINDHLGGHFKLGGHIDATVTKGWNAGAGFEPIGPVPLSTEGSPREVFSGTLDGADFEIVGLYINRPTQDYVGLFSSLANSASIRNFGLVDGNVVGGTEVGGLVGRSWGNVSSVPGPVIEHVYNTGSVTAEGTMAGGLVGRNGYSSLIRHTYNTGPVEGIHYVGGIVGYQHNSTALTDLGNIRESYNSGSIHGEENVGGVIGSAFSSVVRHLYNTGSVNGTEAVGGLIGEFSGGTNYKTIMDSYNMGPVVGEKNVGGVLGYVSDVEILRLYNVGQVTGNEYVAALVSITGNLTDSYYQQGTGPEGSAGVQKTPDEMKQQSTYDGWDFVNVWTVTGDDYPNLRDNPR